MNMVKQLLQFALKFVIFNLLKWTFLMKFKDGKTFSAYVRSNLHSGYITRSLTQQLKPEKIFPVFLFPKLCLLLANPHKPPPLKWKALVIKSLGKRKPPTEVVSLSNVVPVRPTSKATSPYTGINQVHISPNWFTSHLFYPYFIFPCAVSFLFFL